jgi:hypothetical protein
LRLLTNVDYLQAPDFWARMNIKVSNIIMPYKRSPHAKAKRRSSRRNRMKGAGFGDWLGKAFNWLKGNKILSGIGSVLTPLAPEIGAPITAGLKAIGLGRRRRRIGGALRLAGYHRGGSLMPAGGARRVRLIM